MTAPSPNDPLGYDVCIDVTDLDRTGRSAAGIELYEAAVLHRLTCEQLKMIDGDILDAEGDAVIEFGIDVRKWCGEPIDRQSAEAKNPLIDEVLHRDPRTRRVDVSTVVAPDGTVMPSGAMARLLIHLGLTTVTGERIERIVGINEVSVEFLARGT